MTSQDHHISSSAPTGSKVYGNDIQFELAPTSEGFNKTAADITTDILREVIFSVNDSSKIVYGIATPHYTQYDTLMTAVEWDYSHDSLPYTWWNTISNGIRTVPFTVPTSSDFEFGVELYGSNVQDFGPNFRLAIEFRDSAEDTVCLAETIDMSMYDLDSAVYVLDRVDLSTIANREVYMCINPLDTISSCNFNILHVFTPYIEGASKKPTNSFSAEPVLEIGNSYPNPFNPKTSIPFTLQKSASVLIRVYNTNGNVVARLRDGIVRAGQHVVSFDGTNLPSGIYLCVIEAADSVVSTKLHLVK